MVSLSVQQKEHKRLLVTRCICAGIAAATADLSTHPIETAKIRLQIQGEAYQKGHFVETHYRGMVHTMLQVSRDEGIRSLYNGLLTSIQRQFMYSTVRIGCYQPIKKFYLSKFSGLTGRDLGKFTDLWLRIMAASSVCSVGVVLTQPMDVVKLRFQAMHMEKGVARRYTGILNAYRTILREEGFQGLMSGTSANVVRNCVCSTSELVAYDLAKEYLISHYRYRDDTKCHIVAALIAGVVATAFTCPADVIKARMMNSGRDAYSGVLNCVYITMKNEGPMAFYKGVVPLYCRLASWGIVMFLSYEQLKKMFVKGLDD